MGTSHRESLPPSRLALSIIALTIGSAIVLIEAFVVGYLDYLLSAFGDEWGPTLFRALLVSAPFLLLAKRHVTALMPWAVGLALTVLVWGWVIWKHISGGFQNGTSVGNSIWIAIVSLGSTVGITIICALLSHRGRAPLPEASR